MDDKKMGWTRMKKCGNCRADNPDDADFCSACGASMPGAAEGTAGSAQSGMVPGAPSPYAYPDATAYYGATQQPQPYPVVMSVSTNGKAIAALVLSIFGIVSVPIISSIAALILGVQARREIASSGGWQSGDSLARAGIIIGWVGIALYTLLILIVVIIAIVDPDAFSMPLQMGLLIRI